MQLSRTTLIQLATVACLIGTAAASEQETATEQLPTTPSSQFEAFYMSLLMITISEIGDKTFLLAALMAMRYPRKLVFSASGSALVLMTCLSGLLGKVLPALLSPKVTKLIAALLFLVFGLSLLKEGYSMDGTEGVDEELNEVKEEVAAREIKQRSEELEDGLVPHKPFQLFSSPLAPVWFQIFIMTFLGEWGDRSQMATIVMAAGSDYLMVVLGGSLGHLVCALVAVIGGQMLAKKISMKAVILSGASSFLVFSVQYLYSVFIDYGSDI